MVRIKKRPACAGLLLTPSLGFAPFGASAIRRRCPNSLPANLCLTACFLLVAFVVVGIKPGFDLNQLRLGSGFTAVRTMVRFMPRRTR